MLENSFYTNNNVDKQVFNATAAAVVPYVVGQSALGGVIAYILQPGDPGYKDNLQQGYVAAASDQAASVWGCSATSTGATAQALGTGQANTATILANCADRPIAASVAAAVTDGGYTDWYLPSLEELRRLFQNRALIGGFNTTGVLYWSSSEQNNTLSFAVSFNNGTTFGRTKTESNRVRAIRSFSVDITANPWQTWSKPEGRSMAYIVCIGGGGGGGGGFSASGGTTQGGGGGGGGSSAITIAQVPFYSIPDTLYIQVGLGGAAGIGGNPATAGGNGGASYVSCYPTTDMFNCLVLANAGGSGGVGASIGNAAAGSAGGALSNSSTTNPRYLSLCNWASYGGTAGSAGSIGSGSSTSLTINSGSILNGGGGAAGGNNSGTRGTSASLNSGDALTSFLKSVSAGGSVGNAGSNGGNGYSYLKPFMFVGGAGGHAAISGATAGSGGNASLGCGGGGGGGAFGVGGNGGNGGNGLVMIISY